MTKNPKTAAEGDEAVREQPRPTGKWVYFPANLAGSNAWQALSHTAHRLFGFMSAISARTWKRNNGGVFELNYSEIRNSTTIGKDWIAPALRELERAGIIERVRKGYGGPAKDRSGSLFRFTYLDDGRLAFEEERSIKEWKDIFAAVRADKDTAHSHHKKQKVTPPRTPAKKKLFSPRHTDEVCPRHTDAIGGGLSASHVQDPPSFSPRHADAYLSSPYKSLYDGELLEVLPPELAHLQWCAPRRDLPGVVWPVAVTFSVNEHSVERAGSPRVIIRGEAVH
jgi:hypothetical protein